MLGNEKQYVLDCLDSNWISSKGKYVQAFEEAFAAYTGSAHALSVSNGTVALHLALVALGLGPGDEVLVPSFTYIASVNAIAYTGATPVFVDSEHSYWQIDPQDIEKRITPRTRAIMAVHLYGHPCDMHALQDICRRHNLFLIEDAAEALGASYKGQHVGTFGDVATFSFYGNKTITTGEGGMVVTNDHALKERMYSLRGQGLARHREYWHDMVGYNYRMTNICAAIGLAQLEQVDQVLARKRQLAGWYATALQHTPYVLQPQAADCVHSYWMCTLLVPTAKERDPLRERLHAAGVETRPAFYPVHTMPMYNTPYRKLPVADDLGSRGINLPSYPALTQADVATILNSLR